MARNNEVILLAAADRDAETYTDEDGRKTGQIALRFFRSRTEKGFEKQFHRSLRQVKKPEHILLQSKNPEVLRLGVEPVRENDIVLIYGNLCSGPIENIWYCPSCDQPVEGSYDGMYIDPVWCSVVSTLNFIDRLGRTREEADEYLHAHPWVSRVFLSGNTLGDPETTKIYHEKQILSADRFRPQTAGFVAMASRQRFIEYDPLNRMADFFYLRAYHGMADQINDELNADIKHFFVWSQLRETNAKVKNMVCCPDCMSELSQPKQDHELIPDLFFTVTDDEFDYKQEDYPPSLAYFFGYLRDEPCIYEDEESGLKVMEFHLNVVDESTVVPEKIQTGMPSFDTILCQVKDAKLIRRIRDNVQVGDICFVTASLEHGYFPRDSYCTTCGATVEVIPDGTYATVLDLVRDEFKGRTVTKSARAEFRLTEWNAARRRRLANQVYAFGFVVSRIEINHRETPEGESRVTNLRFTLRINVINRVSDYVKQKARDGTEEYIQDWVTEKTSIDVPVVIVGKNVEPYSRMLRKGSGVFVRGRAVTDIRHTQLFPCPMCNDATLLDRLEYEYPETYSLTEEIITSEKWDDLTTVCANPVQLTILSNRIEFLNNYCHLDPETKEPILVEDEDDDWDEEDWGDENGEEAE